MYKAIIFDFDDTLVNTMRVKIKAIQKGAKDLFNKDLEEADIIKLWGVPYDVFNKTIYTEYDEFLKLKDEYESILHSHPSELFIGVNEMIGELSQDYKLGILTSGARHLVEEDMRRFGIDKSKFFVIQTAEDTEVHKPDPLVFAPIVQMLNDMDIKPEDVLYVGDSMSDHKASVANGFDFIAVTTGKYTKADFDSLEVHILDLVTELPSFLKKD